MAQGDGNGAREAATRAEQLFLEMGIERGVQLAQAAAAAIAVTPTGGMRAA